MRHALPVLVLLCTVLWSDRYPVVVEAPQFKGTFFQEIQIRVCENESSVGIYVQSRLLEVVVNSEREMTEWENKVNPRFIWHKGRQGEP